jgi:sulfatase modifying factor 1
MHILRLLIIMVLCVVAWPLRDSHAVSISMVAVGNPGNRNDSNGFGRVTYEYQIGKYEVTIGQYTEFLNAVAKTDPYGLWFFMMENDEWSAGIKRTGTAGSYSYTPLGPVGLSYGQSAANRPIYWVSWFSAARFANWMANGQPTGPLSSSTTEDGAYSLNGIVSGTAPSRNTINPNTSAAPTFYIPTENEWYKAAFFNPTLNSGSGGYYLYATQSNVPPGNILGSGPNQVNGWVNGIQALTQSALVVGQNQLTDVGAFSGSGSFYGTFDQNGNATEWTDLTGVAGTAKGLRGGGWQDPELFFRSSYRVNNAPPDSNGFGFRLAAPIPVPEPSALALGVIGLGLNSFMRLCRSAVPRLRGESQTRPYL